MEFTDFDYFILTADLGSFSKASQILHISQPALSLSIKRLETELGTTLLERSTRRIKLTEAGKVFYENARLMISQRNRTIEKLKAFSEPVETSVRIGISPFYSKYYLPGFLKALAEMKLHVAITENISVILEEELLNGNLDIAFVPAEPGCSGLAYETLKIEEILVAVPGSYEVNSKAINGNGLPYIDITELKDLPFVSLKPVQKITSLVNNVCLNAGFSPNVVFETLDWDTVNIMIGNGIGVGFVPDILYQKPFAELTPNYYRIINEQVFRSYAAAWPQGITLSPAQRNIIDIFRQALIQPALPPYQSTDAD